MSSKVAKFEEYSRKQKLINNKGYKIDADAPCDLCHMSSKVRTHGKALCNKHWSEREYNKEIIKPYEDKMQELEEELQETRKYKKKYDVLISAVTLERLENLGFIKK